MSFFSKLFGRDKKSPQPESKKQGTNYFCTVDRNNYV